MINKVNDNLKIYEYKKSKITRNFYVDMQNKIFIVFLFAKFCITHGFSVPACLENSTYIWDLFR
jgi:hypothetical protein